MCIIFAFKIDYCLIMQFNTKVKYFSNKTNLAIIRGHRECYRMLEVAIESVKEIRSCSVSLKRLHVGGMQLLQVEIFVLIYCF